MATRCFWFRRHCCVSGASGHGEISSFAPMASLGFQDFTLIWGWVKALVPSEPQKIAGLKWMFIPLKWMTIGIDPYPNIWIVHLFAA